MKKIALYAGLFLLSACQTTQNATTKVDDGYKLNPISFSQIDGWSSMNDESLKGFVVAFNKSCKRIAKKDPMKYFGADPEWGTFGKWQLVCQTMPKENITEWLQVNFRALKITTKSGDKEGLFTGYYEASLNGSKYKTEKYNVPLRLKPKDLVSVDLGQFRDDLRGKRIAGRVVNNKLKPYEDRSEIVAEKMPLNVDKTMMWVDSPVDAFFLEIQGSGIAQMADGSVQRVGYAGQNGHEYTAIGRTLIEMGELTKENVSMQAIRTWLDGNPDKAQELMNNNRSYVFFRKLKGNGPLGAEGVELTPQHSLAIDRGLYPYGLPVWIDVENPIADQPNLKRMMVAQDTGGAIKGSIRGDVFWGYGKFAESMAGSMVSYGSMVAFIPK